MPKAMAAAVPQNRMELRVGTLAGVAVRTVSAHQAATGAHGREANVAIMAATIAKMLIMMQNSVMLVFIKTMVVGVKLNRF